MMAQGGHDHQEIELLDSGEISEETFQLFVNNWTDRLDDLSALP